MMHTLDLHLVGFDFNGKREREPYLKAFFKHTSIFLGGKSMRAIYFISFRLPVL